MLICCYILCFCRSTMWPDFWKNIQVGMMSFSLQQVLDILKNAILIFQATNPSVFMGISVSVMMPWFWSPLFCAGFSLDGRFGLYVSILVLMEVSESWCILTILNFCQCLQMCKIRQGCNKWFWGCRTQPRCPYLDVRFHDWWNRPCICPFKSGLQTSNITWIQPWQEHSIQHQNFAVSCTSCHSKLGTRIQLLVYKRQCQHIQMRKIILFNLKKNFVAGAQH